MWDEVSSSLEGERGARPGAATQWLCASISPSINEEVGSADLCSSTQCRHLLILSTADFPRESLKETMA